MNKEPLFVAFSTQKGGIGKTVLTVLTASYLHYVKGYNVAVIDCDYPQHSIAELRERETRQVMSDDYYKRLAYDQFKALNRNAYAVIESTPTEALSSAEGLIPDSDEPLDFVFFDLPGTMNSEGVIKTLSQMDYIFAPMSADRFVLESTLKYAVTINDNIITQGKGKIKGLHLIWNMVDGRERSELYEVYDKIISELGLQVLKTVLPDSKKFRREFTAGHKALFRSTLFPADKVLLKNSNLIEFIDEVESILKA